MYIYLSTTRDNVPVSVHRVTRVEIQSGQVAVLLHSSDPTNEAANGLFHTHSMPIESFSAAPYPQCVNDWLTGAGGPLEGGAVVEGENLNLEGKQAVLTAQAEKQRDLHIHGGIVFQGLGIDTNEVSLRNIMGTAQLASLALMNAQPFQVAWRCSDNSTANFDATNFIELAQSVMQHVQSCYQRSWELKEEIAAATEETIDGINPSIGWPV